MTGLFKLPLQPDSKYKDDDDSDDENMMTKTMTKMMMTTTRIRDYCSQDKTNIE